MWECKGSVFYLYTRSGLDVGRGSVVMRDRPLSLVGKNG